MGNFTPNLKRLIHGLKSATLRFEGGHLPLHEGMISSKLN